MSKGNSTTTHREREFYLSSNWPLALIHRVAIPVLCNAPSPPEHRMIIQYCPENANTKPEKN